MVEKWYVIGAKVEGNDFRGSPEVTKCARLKKGNADQESNPTLRATPVVLNVSPLLLQGRVPVFHENQ